MKHIRAGSLAPAVLALLVITMAAPPAALAHCPGATTPAYLTTFFAPIRPGGTRITLELVATGFTAPLKALAAPGEPDRLYVVDQPGRVWAVDLATGAATPFLDVGGRLVTLGVLGPGTFDERGFLGLAFHPDYPSNGKLYTYTSEPATGPPSFTTTLPPGRPPDHQNVVAEWQAVSPGDPALGVDPASRRELMRVDWPQFNHDGGDLAFGPDGMLYISMGDGGGADDADGQLFVKATGGFPVVNEPIAGHQGDGNAQKLNSPLGKILRIDVGGADSANGQYGIPADNPFAGGGPLAVGEIFAFGFRNPFRFSFDAPTGRLFVGDAGQNDIEEVDIVVKGGNHGWNVKEGALFFHINGTEEGFAGPAPDPSRVLPAALIDPVAQYDTHGEGHSAIGGHVYRGARIRQLQGRYVFGDFSRIFNFPLGPDNFGRLLFLEPKRLGERLVEVQEFRGFRESLDRLGLILPNPNCFPETMSVLGLGQDAAGEVYVTGNQTGRPFGTDGFLLRIAPVARR